MKLENLLVVVTLAAALPTPILFNDGSHRGVARRLQNTPVGQQAVSPRKRTFSQPQPPRQEKKSEDKGFVDWAWNGVKSAASATKSWIKKNEHHINEALLMDSAMSVGRYK